LVAAVLGATAALPAAWGVGIEAKMEVTEAELRDLGADPDPYLEFRLLRLAEKADSLDGLIRYPAELLFEAWSQTGQENDPLPMWLTLWGPGDLPREDLAMGVQGVRPSVADDYLDQVRQGSEPLVIHLGFANARYLLVVPLEGRRVLSAVVPPRGSTSLAAPLGPIFAALGRPTGAPHSLVPASPYQEPDAMEGVEWERRDEGWQARWILRYVDGDFFATQTVALPGTLHLLARGTLALLLDLTVVLLVLGAGRLLLLGTEIEPRKIFRFFGSFRARVTMALFGFFLLSIAIFGTLAFRTLSGAAERTASALAERIVEDGASFYSDVQGVMELLAREVGADLLEYRDGELLDGSADELVQLGLYEGWIPEPLYRAFEQRRDLRASLRSSLGGWEYVMAYRRLEDTDILASPVPLELGATALRRQEVADLLGFAIVLGGALSLALALLVGRALSRPIETLQIASERVGSGNLKVRLPEDRRDEFGAVFGAFNRMVLRIRRARKALLRTTRRTQAIVEEAATGVVALDSSGRVTLVNPRAESLLNEAIPIGKPLPGREGEAGEFVRWVDLYFRDGLREAHTELQMGDRRIRIRARRVSAEGPIGGAVLSLEDVTDELRSERILAWGEMAQQVAHEVKNPLTPMKLSVQHLQRAWEDRRPDFHEILKKNVEVIVREIDHLAAIARSFSRFGAPQATGQLPLEAVSIHQVAEEVMSLYRGGKGALTFTCAIPQDVPAVQAREPELREVLINLLENSRAAIPSQGEVAVEAELHQRGVELRVRDDGTGIDPDFLPRIFEPHFSTRSMGTGLGLAIVRRLVESWGGSISAESEVGKGTVVRMVIPLWGGAERSRQTLDTEDDE
jgi:signal transduction histidine kinase/HAMP domain-containing protein